MEALRRVWDDFSLTLPGGESSAECQRRVEEALSDLEARHDPDQRVLVCSHGNAIGLYLHGLDGSFGFESWKEMQNPDLFAIQGDRWRRLDLQMTSLSVSP